MKSFGAAAAVVLVGMGAAVAIGFRAGATGLLPEERATAAYVAGVDSLRAAADALRDLAATGTGVEQLRTAFAVARSRWKHVELLAEHYTPVIAEGINGPPIPEIDDDDPTRTEIPAEGFQVVEELLWPEYDPATAARLQEETAILSANVARLVLLASATPLTASNVFDAARSEILRIASLGISGFDSPAAERSLVEAAEALRGVRDALTPWDAAVQHANADASEALATAFQRAIVDLERGEDFDGFDRLGFTVERLEPVVVAIQGAREALGVSLADVPRAWRADATSMFGADAFDAHAFARVGTPRPTPAVVELGRVLFFDPVLSGDGRRACASCHRPEDAFADRTARSVAFGERGTVARNAPTLLNAGMQRGAFADLRVAYLEDQANAVLGNASEMHGSAAAAATRLMGSPEYRELFAGAFGGEATAERVVGAIAAYVRSLVALDSRFDRYARGERDALTDEERAGFNIFMGKGKCGTCHFFPLFHGTVPPAFVETELEVLGVPTRPDTVGAVLDTDVGRGALRGNPLHQFAFRTPTVRNIGATAPYMHNGAYTTLAQVVEFYEMGGGAGIGAPVEHQTLPPERLGLTAAEKLQLIAFLHALSDTTSVSASTPARLPAFPTEPALDARPVGGAY